MSDEDRSLAGGPGARGGLTRVRLGGLRWTVRASALGEGLLEVLRDPGAHLRAPAHVFKNSKVVRIVRVPLNGPGQLNLVLRCLNYGKTAHRLRDFFRRSRAERAFHCGWELEQAGVATPRVIAAGVQRRCRWPVRAYLVTEEIPGARTLPDFYVSRLDFPRAVVTRLGRLLAQLHQQGFSHRDLKLSNILLDHALEPYLIDLDGVRRLGRLSDAEAVDDLALPARFAKPVLRLSRTDRMHFLQVYCAARERDDWRWWWQAIQARAQAWPSGRR